MKRADSDLALRRNYTYVEREVQKSLDSRGAVKKQEIHTYDIVMVGSRRHARLIASNDQPLTEKQAQKEAERMRRAEEKDQERAGRHDPVKDKEKE
ncbi:MAG: hypothetical protein JO041_09830, partial [Acidobacteria bacterium]|nr:hypothetical protein [Acidobacteriota bacterium]